MWTFRRHSSRMATCASCANCWITVACRLWRWLHISPAKQSPIRSSTSAIRAFFPREFGVTFALEIHPGEIAYDYWTTKRTLAAINNRAAFGINFDPSHLYWQLLDPVEFVYEFGDKIYHMHVKESVRNLNGRNGIISSHLFFGDHRRGWDFVSPGRGGVPFERIFRALNDVGYQGPLSIEWEDNGMNREQGAPQAVELVRRLDLTPSSQAFEEAFKQK